jgi:hypothetical protein
MMEQGGERHRAAVVALVAVGIPVAAEIAASVSGNDAGRGYGPVFQTGVVLGAIVATWLATRRGLWWLVPAQPLIVVLTAVAGTVLNEPGGTKRTKLGTDAATALQHAFLIALAAVAVVVIAAVAKAVAGRPDDSSPRPASAPRRTTAAGAQRTGARRG